MLDPNVLTLGFARRFAEYKRPNLLLSDRERFVAILRNAERPVQIIVAGKAHPNDDGGKAMIQNLARFSHREDVRDRVVFLDGAIHSLVNGQIYRASVASQRPAEHFTPRMVPRHPDACGPMDNMWMFWQR